MSFKELVAGDIEVEREMLLDRPMTVGCWKCGITLFDGPAREGIALAKQHAFTVHGVAYRRKRITRSAASVRESVRRGTENAMSNRKWTRESLIVWRDAFIAEHGRAPKTRDKGKPDEKAVKREFGGWKQMLAYKDAE